MLQIFDNLFHYKNIVTVQWIKRLKLCMVTMVTLPPAKELKIQVVSWQNEIRTLDVLKSPTWLNEFCLFEFTFCVFESCQVRLPGLKQYLEEINVSCSRTKAVAVSQVRLEPITFRSRVKHSTIKSLRSLIGILHCGLNSSGDSSVCT